MAPPIRIEENNFLFSYANMNDKKTQTLYLRQLGSKIRQRRFELDLTQEDIALEIECNAAHYSEIERGNVNPSYLMLIRLARGLNISPKDLMPE